MLAGSILFFILGGFLYIASCRILRHNIRALRKMQHANEARTKLNLAAQRWRR
jgi:hypothetical protein